jgi:hypothetical protein
MRLSVLAYAALIAALTVPILLFAAGDRQAAVVQKHSSHLGADPDLKLATERSPYMRTER